MNYGELENLLKESYTKIKCTVPQLIVSQLIYQVIQARGINSSIKFNIEVKYVCPSTDIEYYTIKFKKNPKHNITIYYRGAYKDEDDYKVTQKEIDNLTNNKYGAWIIISNHTMKTVDKFFLEYMSKY